MILYLRTYYFSLSLGCRTWINQRFITKWDMCSLPLHTGWLIYWQLMRELVYKLWMLMRAIVKTISPKWSWDYVLFPETECWRKEYYSLKITEITWQNPKVAILIALSDWIYIKLVAIEWIAFLESQIGSIVSCVTNTGELQRLVWNYRKKLECFRVCYTVLREMWHSGSKKGRKKCAVKKI